MSSLRRFRPSAPSALSCPPKPSTERIDLRMPGQSAPDYQLRRAWPSTPPSPAPGMRPWAPTANGKIALTRLPSDDAATKVTRDKWLLPLLYELGYGGPRRCPAASTFRQDLERLQPKHFPISHRSPGPMPADPEAEAAVPLHLVGGWRRPRQSQTPGVTARAPQSMLQDYLNR